MHRKLIAIEKGPLRQTPDHMVLSKVVSQSQNFYALPPHEAGGTFGPTSPLGVTTDIHAYPFSGSIPGITSGQTKL